MHDDSPKKFDRIVAILIQLQSKKIVKAQELADRFEVSLRTIYRDIRTLEASGVPLYGEAGTGYALVDGYRLPPVMFTREEAQSFIAAEKLMEQFSDPTLKSHHESALYKIKSVLRADEKEMLEDIESSVIVRRRAGTSQKVPNALAVILRSISEKVQVVLDYQANEADEPTKRTVEPVGIFHQSNHWYIYAYCHLRDDYRQFRTDRIHGMTLTNEPFSREHPTLAEFIERESTENMESVKILIDKSVVKYIRNDLVSWGLTHEFDRGNQIEAHFKSRHLSEGLARFFMMFGDYIDIIEPESLKERMVELAKKIQARLKK